MKYSLLLVAGALLFVQFAHALPRMKRESVTVEIQTQNSTDDSLLTENDKRKADILIKFGKYTRWVHLKGSVLIKNTLKELSEIPVKDELLQANITRLSELVKLSEFSYRNNSHILQNLITFMKKFEQMIEDYENMPDDSQLKQTLQRAFENNGYKKFESEYEKRTSQCENEIFEALDELVKVLSPEEKAEEVQMVKLFEEMTEEHEEEDETADS